MSLSLWAETETPSSDIDSKMSIHSQNKIHSKAKDERELTLVKMGNLQNSSVSIGGGSFGIILCVEQFSNTLFELTA